MSSQNNEKRIKVVEELLEFLEQNLNKLQRKLDDTLVRNILAPKKKQRKTQLNIDLDKDNHYFIIGPEEGKLQIPFPAAIDIAFDEKLIDQEEYLETKAEIGAKYIECILGNKDLWVGYKLNELGFAGKPEDLQPIKDILFAPPNQLMFLYDKDGTEVKTYVSIDFLKFLSYFKMLNKWLKFLEG